MTDDAIKYRQFHVHRTVFWTSTCLIVFFVAFSLVNLAQMKEVFDAVRAAITDRAGWLFVGAVNIYLAIVVYLLMSRYGSIRLGGQRRARVFNMGMVGDAVQRRHGDRPCVLERSRADLPLLGATVGPA